MDLAARIGGRLRVLREARGMTQEALAWSGPPVSSKSYLSEIEAGKKLPSLEALAALADRLGVHICDLLVDPDGSTRERLMDASRDASDIALGEALERLLAGRGRR